MFISGIYALADEMEKAENGLSTSAVDIEIKEYNKDNEPFGEETKHVTPGEEVILIPKINNLGIECYLRTKITYTVNNENLNIEDYIDGNYKNWTKKGEYYYYDSIFQKEDSISLFNKLKIPNNIPEESADKPIIAHIVVEAIQAKNFDGSWDGIEIKESINRTYDIDYQGESSIVYEDSSHNHILLDDHFFDNLGNLLPGDSISEEVIILNNSNTKNKYFLNIEYDDLTTEEKNLLHQIKLTIKNKKGELLVSSNLEDKSKHTLGTFSHYEGDTLTIELSLPKDIDNDYSKLFTKIRWRFSYDVIGHGEIIPINPKTWHLKFALSITVFLLFTLGFITVLILGNKSTDNIKNKKKERRI